jgi:hypothetical protein
MPTLFYSEFILIKHTKFDFSLVYERKGLRAITKMDLREKGWIHGLDYSSPALSLPPLCLLAASDPFICFLVDITLVSD